MRLSLDRNALFALIQADPDFELELKQSVMAEVARRMFEKDATKIIAAAEPQLFAEAVKALQQDEDISEKVRRALEKQLVVRSTYYDIKLSPEAQRAFDSALVTAKRRVEESILTTLGSTVEEAVQRALTEPSGDLTIEERIERRVVRLTDEAIDKMAREAVEARLAAAKAALS